MAYRRLHQDDKSKTVLWFREDQGLSIELYDKATKQTRKSTLISVATLDALMEQWPILRSELGIAPVDTAAPATHSQSTSMASPAQGSLLSSTEAP